MGSRTPTEFLNKRSHAVDHRICEFMSAPEQDFTTPREDIVLEDHAFEQFSNGQRPTLLSPEDNHPRTLQRRLSS
jgi:hypothetical protein